MCWLQTHTIQVNIKVLHDLQYQMPFSDQGRN